MTNYDRIKAMSVDEMAVMLTTIIHERDMELIKQFTHTSGLAISITELSPDIQAAIHKNWLESEVYNNE